MGWFAKDISTPITEVKYYRKTSKNKELTKNLKEQFLKKKLARS